MKSVVRNALLVFSLVALGWGCSSDEKDSAQQTAKAVEAAKKPSAAQAPEVKLNVNRATGAQYSVIPGVGRRVLHELEQNRPFESLGELREEIGQHIDANTVAQFEQHFFVPIKVNDADVETLQQIEGVTEKVAKKLIEKRPFSTNAAFLMELAKQTSDAQARSGAALLYNP